MSNHSTIVVNSEVIEVVLFDWIQHYCDYTDFIFLMHSHSYFKKHLHYFVFRCIHIPTKTITLKSHYSLLKQLSLKTRWVQLLCLYWHNSFDWQILLQQYMIIKLSIIVNVIIILPFVYCGSKVASFCLIIT